MIKCIAIDDEPIALEVMRAHAARVPFIALEKTFLSSVIACRYLENNPVDFVLLDINMPGLSGLEMADLIKNKTRIIFTTAHPEHAVRGFDLAVADYLVKPINFNRFLEACRRVENLVTENKTESHGQSFFIKEGYEWTKINTEDLLYIEANDNYLTFYQKEKKILTRMSLTEAQEKLPADKFIRTHRSFIVNFKKVEKVEKDKVLIEGISIPLSSTYQKVIFDKLRH